MDVLGIGCCAVDDVLYVNSYPQPDSKIAVTRRQRRCGGLTAVALMTAAQLGASSAFAGVLGDDELSAFALRCMSECGVNTEPTVVRSGAGAGHSVIIVDESTGTRTILADSSRIVGADDDAPSGELIRSAKVLLIDHHGVHGLIRACRIAREARIPVVADLERETDPNFGELLRLVDHLILSSSFAAKLTGSNDPATAARKLSNDDRAVVVITAGSGGCWYVDREGADTTQHCAAFEVAAVDTTGCGDVFHGAYAAGLSQGLTLPERLRLASAAAALKASGTFGPTGIPDALDVHRLCASQIREPNNLKPEPCA
jgi:sugar/nucleoside kinase (ribokinase family)